MAVWGELERMKRGWSREWTAKARERCGARMEKKRGIPEESKVKRRKGKVIDKNRESVEMAKCKRMADSKRTRGVIDDQWFEVRRNPIWGT